MIVSASYKTDIPTFFGEWLINRLRAGHCKMVNPYNRRVIRVSLRPEDVSGIVFWTKNVGPFLKHLPEVRSLGFPFVVQHTINGYPRALEYSVVDAEKSVENLRRIAAEFGPNVCVWRYDTIIFSSLTPYDFHLRNFERLAKRLAGATDEVVLSFAQFYRKTLRNMTWAGEKYGFSWEDPADDVKLRLATELVAIASANGIQLSVCSQRSYLVPGAVDARCIDADRLEKIMGKRLSVPVRGNRKECGCFESRDIGEYDTCPHGCVYCYSVQNRQLAANRFKQHDPSSEYLFQPDAPAEELRAGGSLQLPLFPNSA